MSRFSFTTVLITCASAAIVTCLLSEFVCQMPGDTDDLPSKNGSQPNEDIQMTDNKLSERQELEAERLWLAGLSLPEAKRQAQSNLADPNSKGED